MCNTTQASRPVRTSQRISLFDSRKCRKRQEAGINCVAADVRRRTVGAPDGLHLPMSPAKPASVNQHGSKSRRARAFGIFPRTVPHVDQGCGFTAKFGGGAQKDFPV